MKASKKEYLILGVILFLGLLIRLYHFNTFSLSNDELSAIYRLNFNSLHDLIIGGVMPDFHPAGVQIFLYYWTQIFGTSVTAIRLPFIIAGTLAILFIYLFSKRWFGSTPALLSAASIAFLSFPIMYSQIARPYSLGLLLILFLSWAWSIVLRPTKNEKQYIWLYSVLLGIAFSLNLYNHYFSGLLAFIIGILGFSFINKNNSKPYLAATLIGTLLFIPHIQITLHHLSKGGLSTWLGAPSWDWPIGHIGFIFNTYFNILFILIAIFLLRRNAIKHYSKSKIRTLLFLFFILPLLIGLLYSKFVNPVLQDSILIFSMPFIMVFIFSFAPSTLNNKSIYSIASLSIIFILTTLFIPQERKVDVQNFKGIAKHLQKWNQENPSESYIRIMDSNSPEYLKYYLKDDTNTIRFDQWKIEDDQDLKALQNILDNSQAEYLNYVVLAPDNSIAWNMIINHFPYKKHSIVYKKNAQAYELSRSNKRGEVNLWDFPNNCLAKIKIDSCMLLQDVKYSDGLVYKFESELIDTEEEFEYIVYTKGKFLDSAVNIGAHIVFSINYDDGDSYWSSAPLHYFIHSNIEQSIYYVKQLPEIKPNALLKVYIWNPNNEKLQVSNFQICLSRKKI